MRDRTRRLQGGLHYSSVRLSGADAGQRAQRLWTAETKEKSFSRASRPVIVDAV